MAYHRFLIASQVVPKSDYITALSFDAPQEALDHLLNLVVITEQPLWALL